MVKLDHIDRKEEYELVALSSQNAIEFIVKKGIPMSKSKLYKMVTREDCSIPYYRAGSRLIFYSHELELWCKNQITIPNKTTNKITNHIIYVANKKTK